MLSEDAIRVITEQRLGFVATVNADGTPNLSPKGTFTVRDERTVMFANIRSPQTLANIASNPAVEVNVVDPIVRKGYRVAGTARLVTEGVEHDELVAFYVENWNLEPDRIDGIVVIDVTRVRPVISPAYDWGSTEAEVTSEWRRWWAGLGVRVDH